MSAALISQIGIVFLVAGIILVFSVACIAAESDRRMDEAMKKKLKEIDMEQNENI